jgi:5-formyltetrahydrofolate cyclo-ligase
LQIKINYYNIVVNHLHIISQGKEFDMKKSIRKEILEIRKNKSSDFVNNASNTIVDKIISLDEIKKADNIMLYLDFKNEVQMDRLVNKLKSLGKMVCSPITVLDQKKLIPAEITDLEEGISISTYGIREPLNTNSHIDLKSIDVVIVPGVAFDLNCFRLGYGAGLYDRFLENIRTDAKTIGVAFDFQILDTVPTEPHDKQLDMIVTEIRNIL